MPCEWRLQGVAGFASFVVIVLGSAFCFLAPWPTLEFWELDFGTLQEAELITLQVVMRGGAPRSFTHDWSSSCHT